MTTLVLTFDDDRIDDDQRPTALATHPAGADTTADASVPLDALQEALATLPDGAVEVYHTVRHPDWEHGEPCPECGHETMSVMGAEEDLYESQDGEFRYVKKGEAIGPHLSILCPECMTYLMDTPYERLVA